MAKRKMSTWERLRSGKMNRKEPREWPQRLDAEDAGREVVHSDAAGIDVGNASHFVAVPPDRDEQPCGSLDHGRRICGTWRNG
jgi:hypothetical protein